MIRVANPARGEVELKIGSENYVLAATFANLASLQGALQIEGLPTMLRMITQLDPRALYHGVKCLAISGNTKLIDTEPFYAHMLEVQQALIKAITGVMEPAKENPPPAVAEK